MATRKFKVEAHSRRRYSIEVVANSRIEARAIAASITKQNWTDKELDEDFEIESVSLVQD